MNRNKIFEKKLEAASKLSIKEKQLIELLPESEMDDLIIEADSLHKKYLNYIQDICKYLLDSETPDLEVTEALEDFANAIEDTILMDLRNMRVQLMEHHFDHTFIKIIGG